MPRSSSPTTCSARAIASPIARVPAARSLPNRVRSTIRWVMSAIARRTSSRSPSRHCSAASRAQSTMVVAYPRTCRGRTVGCTRERLRRQSAPRLRMTLRPTSCLNAQPISRISKVCSRAASISAMCCGWARNRLRRGPSDQVTVSPKSSRRRTRKASGSLPNSGRFPSHGSPRGPATGRSGTDTDGDTDMAPPGRCELSAAAGTGPGRLPGAASLRLPGGSGRSPATHRVTGTAREAAGARRRARVALGPAPGRSGAPAQAPVEQTAYTAPLTGARCGML